MSVIDGKCDREGGFLARRIMSLVMVASLFLLLAGCGGGGQGSNPPETSFAQGKTVVMARTTAEKATGVPGQTRQRQSGATNEEDYCIEKQFAEATQGMSQPEAGDYETGVISEAVERGLDPRTVLAERGFVC